MKLEVGMYVRTKYLDDEGYLLEPVIAKIKDMTDYSIYLDDFGDCKEEHIIKTSHNIIDLIEVGDYVDGYRVDYIENTNANNIFILQRIFCEEYEKDLYAKSFKPSEIKSIVTKEQFEAMKYEIK